MSEPWPIVDLRALEEGADLAPHAEEYREFCGAVVMAATARAGPVAEAHVPVPCAASPDSLACAGWLRIGMDPEKESITWWCERCSLRGVLRGWSGSVFDLSRIELPGTREQGRGQELEMTASEHHALLGVEFGDPVVRRLLHSARRTAGGTVLRAPEETLRRLLGAMNAAAAHASTRADWDLFDAVFTRLERRLSD